MTKKFTIIGIMTGTSLDAIDLAIVDFYFIDNEFTYKELFFKEYPFPDKLKNKILDIISSKTSIYNISQLNFALSDIYAGAVNNAIEESGIEKYSINAIGVHGQTLWHQPQKSKFADFNISSTLQLGNLSALNILTDIPVIGDFRSADIALGGEGAPLVPIFDFYFLRSEKENNLCLNIGGIANITYLPKNCSKKDVIGFDTGPGNILIDIATSLYFNNKFDFNGNFARKGNLNIDILNELMNDSYISKKFPKSTGREIFNTMYFNKFFDENSNPNNVLNTLTHFTAKSIAKNIETNNLDVDNIIVSGGGAYNSYLMELLQFYLPNSKVKSSENFGVRISSKEAVCFAFLALLYILDLSGNIPSVTGAKRECKLGQFAG